MMIQDPFMASQMQDFIDNGQCAEAALDAVCNMYIEMFSSVEDDLTNQRATDIRDLRTRLMKILLGQEDIDLRTVEPGTVLVAADFTPSMTAGIQKDNIAGIVTQTGSKTSHSAILARALEIPAVMSVENACTNLKTAKPSLLTAAAARSLPTPNRVCLKRIEQNKSTNSTKNRRFVRFSANAPKRRTAKCSRCIPISANPPTPAQF